MMGKKDKHKMGQSRNNPVFKVVGGKAGKKKNKAQEVNLKLKNVSNIILPIIWRQDSSLGGALFSPCYVCLFYTVYKPCGNTIGRRSIYWSCWQTCNYGTDNRRLQRNFVWQI